MDTGISSMLQDMDDDVEFAVIWTCTHTHTCTNVHTHWHTHGHTHTHTHTHTHVHVHTHTHTHTHVHVHTRTHITHTYTRMHTHTHAHTHVRTHTHTYAHTHTPYSAKSKSILELAACSRDHTHQNRWEAYRNRTTKYINISHHNLRTRLFMPSVCIRQ